jgi:hypothetical protein
MTLTPAQRRLLTELKLRGGSGSFFAPNWGTVRALCRLGLITYQAHGMRTVEMHLTASGKAIS